MLEKVPRRDLAEKSAVIYEQNLTPEWKLLISQNTDSEATKEESLSITLYDSRQVCIDLSQVFGDITFVSGSSTAAKVNQALVRIKMEAAADKRYIFVILHEIGHIIRWRKMSQEKRKEHDIVYKDMEWWESLGESLVQNMSARAVQELIHHERNAWAEAIHCARILKEKYECNLFAIFPSHEIFSGWLRAISLRAYERIASDKKIGTFSKDTLVTAWATEQQRSGDFLEDESIQAIKCWAE